MAGFGLDPAGLFPFGIGTPADPPAAPSGPAGSRFINPTTRDYEKDATSGQFKQMPGNRQRVLLALMTEHNSSALRGFGAKRAPRMGDSFEAESRSHIQEALRHMTEIERVIRVTRIDVERGAGGRARFTVSYHDLLTQEDEQVTG